MSQEASGQNRRSHRRLPIEKAEAVSIVVNFLDDRTGTVEAVARDISRGGVVVMHEKSVKDGAQCTVEFKLPGGPSRVLKAMVVNCQRIGLPLYRIGLRFDDELTEDEVRAFASVAGSV